MQADDAHTLLKANYQRILDLYHEGKWQEAHRGCLEILQYDPENLKIIRLKNKIEKIVQKINRDALKKDLEQIKPLWHEKKFAEILAYLHKLEPYASDYPPLRKLLIRAQKAYNNETYRQQEEHFKETIAAIQTIAQNGKFQEAIHETEKLRLLKLHDASLQNLIQKIRSDWIHSEISKNQALLNSTKYEDILLFYQHLKQIDPRNELLDREIVKTKKQYQLYKIEEKKEFIYKGSEEVRTLYQLKKYEKAVQAAKEILEIDPSNREVRFYYKKALVKTNHLISNEVITQMLSAQKQHQKEYPLNKSAFYKF